MVLRTHKLGEADRIITLLTRNHGKVRAVARGIRRTSSRFGGRLEPFSHVDAQFATGRTLDYVNQAETLHAYDAPLRVDYACFTAGEVMVETADRLVCEEREPAPSQYRLLLGALRTLGEGTPEGPRPARMILDSYLLRAMAIAGYAPALESCARCGVPGPHVGFAPEAGGMVCSGCCPPRTVLPSPRGWALLSALISGDWAATTVPEATAREVSGLVAAFASWHLDHGLRSLDLVEN
ncbi:DNA repair protein RecO [Propionibacterium sp. oral taxon 192 str. F0372]|nr:DNA repair protein RecO [Propionibacterium sp. oral taxon 192 str. F0372]